MRKSFAISRVTGVVPAGVAPRVAIPEPTPESSRQPDILTFSPLRQPIPPGAPQAERACISFGIVGVRGAVSISNHERRIPAILTGKSTDSERFQFSKAHRENLPFLK
jgi:hypothetical protein